MSMRKNIISLTLAVTMLASTVCGVANTFSQTTVQAASQKVQYVNAKSFVKDLQKEVDKKRKGIGKKPIKISTKGVNLSGKLNYVDACVLVDRADTILNGDYYKETVKVESKQNDGVEYVFNPNDSKWYVDPVHQQGRIRLYSKKEVKENIIKFKRIADLSKVPKVKRDRVIAVYQKGIFKGDVKGTMPQSSYFSGKKYVTVAQAKDLVSKTVSPEYVTFKRSEKLPNGTTRFGVTPDGQVIRTTNLPKNAKYLEYVVEGVPNWFYDMKFNWSANPMTGNYPKYIWGATAIGELNAEKDEYRFILADRVQKYLETRLNVDYRTVDDAWMRKINTARYGTGEDFLWNKNNKYMNEVYLPNMKKYNVVSKSTKIYVDPWSFYVNKNNENTFRCYAEFTTWGSKEAYEDQDDRLFYSNDDMHLPVLANGKTVRLVFEIGLNCPVEMVKEHTGKNLYPAHDSMSANWRVIK